MLRLLMPDGGMLAGQNRLSTGGYKMLTLQGANK